MTPQRRGTLATLLALGLMLVAVGGIALATSMSASPAKGARDNGSGAETPITLTGDLLDGALTGPSWTSPHVYWDLPNPNSPNSSYEITLNSSSIAAGGEFTVGTEVPWYDHNLAPVRPGNHVITFCATRSPSTAGFPICVSDGFAVLKGSATLNKTSGRQGSPLTISGKRWVPEAVDEPIRITWDPNGANLDMIGDQFGPSTWSHGFDVPDLPAGTYQIRICNVLQSGRLRVCHDSGSLATSDRVFQQFTILDPILSLNKSTGQTGEQFSYQGQIFFPNQLVKIWFGPKGSDSPTDPGVHEIGPGGATTNSDGNFGPFTYTPSEGPGEYVVIACTMSRTLCNPRDVDQQPYVISAPATPSPTPKPTASPTPAPTATPSPAPTATPSASPTSTPSASPTLTASPTQSASPTLSLAPTVAPVSAPPTEAPSPPPTVPPSDAPTPAPTLTADPEITWPEHLRSPGQTASGGGIDLTTLGTMSLLALLIAFLVPFPGTLFNKTVEANHAEIMAGIAGLKRRWASLLDRIAIGPLGGVRRFLGRLVTGRLGVLVFLGMSALVYSFLSPTFGFDTNSLALFLGLLVGLGFIVAAFDLPLRIYHGRTSSSHDRGVLRALWWTLLVAVICVIVSRLANFQPGYLYGLVVSIVFVTEISLRNEGVGMWLASIWLIILSFVAWVLLAIVREGAGFDPWLSLFLQTVLVTFVVAGIETLAVGLLPMRFLPGHLLYRWRRGMWFVVFALSVMGYLLILVDPANGYLSDDSRTPMLVGVIFLLTFGIVSFGTWAYFRFRAPRPGLDRPGEAPVA